MKKKYLVFVIFFFVVVALYNSVYFEKLDSKRQQETKKNFNPKESVDFFWKNKLDEILKSAIDLKLFDSLVAANPNILIKQYGKSVGITSNYSFLVKGLAKTVAPGAEAIPVIITHGNARYKLFIKYLFGNSARNATGYFNIDDFENTMDFNAVATELNSLILKKVIANKLNSLTPGVDIKFVGALELNSENIQKELEIVPLKLEIIR
ncbi:MAG: DUF2291 family protein [Ignavibacteria bacterium]|nr:DUF2291 family protein [Ignavibacteria bacterium]